MTKLTNLRKSEGSATRNPDSRFKRFCQIFIKIRDSSQDLKYFKSLEYCEILLLLAVNTEMLQRFKILPVSYKILDSKRDLSVAKYKIYSVI